MVYFALTVPSISPIFAAGFNTSSKSLTIKWSHIPPDFINGYLLGYIIMYEINSEVDGSQPVRIDTKPQELSKNISDLLVYTEYCVRVAGRTRIGTGNWSDCLNITTDEEGEAADIRNMSAKRTCVHLSINGIY